MHLFAFYSFTYLLTSLYTPLCIYLLFYIYISLSDCKKQTDIYCQIFDCNELQSVGLSHAVRDPQVEINSHYNISNTPCPRIT